MPKRGKKQDNSSLFSADEIAGFSDQGVNLPETGKDVAPVNAPGQETQPLSGKIYDRTLVDDSAIKAALPALDNANARFKMRAEVRSIIVLSVVLVVVYVLAVLFPQNLSSLIDAGDGAAARLSTLITSNVKQNVLVLTGQTVTGLSNSSILNYALVAVAGAGLGAVGAAYQGSFSNPLASPSTLGVMSGASCGLVIFLAIGGTSDVTYVNTAVITQEQAAQFQGDALSPLAMYLTQMEGVFWSLAGALVVVGLTVLIAKLAGKGKMSNATLVIAGQVFGAVSSAIVVLYRLYLQSVGGKDSVMSLASLQTGDLTSIGNFYDIFFMGIPVLVCIALLCFFAGKLNLLAFGDEQSRAMGMNPSLLRAIVIGFSTLATAIIVAFCGSIGFVGFMIPHLVRRVIGPDFRYLIPASALAAASFTLIAQYAYSCVCLNQGGVGLVTTAIGAVVFIAAIVRERRNPSAVTSKQEF